MAQFIWNAGVFVLSLILTGLMAGGVLLVALWVVGLGLGL